MKDYLIISLAALLMATVIATAEPQYTVTTSAVEKIAPDRTVKNGVTFAINTAVAQGVYLETSTEEIYMVLVAGTTGGTEPSGSIGSVTSGTATLYRVMPSKRKGLLISNVGAVDGYFTVAYPGTGSTPGVLLSPGAIVTIPSGVQDAVYGGTNATFSVQEY